MYKSRWDAIHQAWTIGIEQAHQMKLGDDINNWTPLMIYLFQSAVLATGIPMIILTLIATIIILSIR